LRNCYKNAIAPDVGTDVAETVSKDVEDIVDTGQDRSSTNWYTPLVARLDNKSLAFMCNEQVSRQISTATQFVSNKHRFMQSATDDNG